MEFILNGARRTLDAATIRSALRGGAPDPVREHWVDVDGVRWPPKQALALATGLDRADFTSHRALGLFERLGFRTSPRGADRPTPASSRTATPRATERPGKEPAASRGSLPQAAAADVSWLLDERNAISPADFLAAGRAAYDVPGLCSWWVDSAGAHSLSAGLGHQVVPGLVFAGRAGGRRPSGKVSTNTLWGRVGGMHLEGSREFSTLRLSLTAALRNSAEPVEDESSLTLWMHEHMRVAVLPLPAEAVFAAEKRLLKVADPPLNLQGMTATPLRRTLSRLRSAASGQD